MQAYFQSFKTYILFRLQAFCYHYVLWKRARRIKRQQRIIIFSLMKHEVALDWYEQHAYYRKAEEVRQKMDEAITKCRIDYQLGTIPKLTYYRLKWWLLFGKD